MLLVRKLLQVLLGLTLCYTGVLHLTSKRSEFQAQVPSWLPLDPDFVVIASGIVEILLGLALLTLWKNREQVGVATAIFFLLIFPGNVWQYLDGIDAFGLNTDTQRGVRLLFQPVLVVWALWSTESILTGKQTNFNN
ncbi:MAG: DoxX family membrane protein [Actinobacteria bacterium]|nr:DoxX family membrane protein [Actinomycetota bacterium]